MACCHVCSAATSDEAELMSGSTPRRPESDSRRVASLIEGIRGVGRLIIGGSANEVSSKSMMHSQQVSPGSYIYIYIYIFIYICIYICIYNIIYR